MPNDEHAPTASPTSAQVAEAGTPVVGFFVIALIAYYFGVWNHVQSLQARSFILAGIVAVFLVLGALLARYEKGREVWVAFVEKGRFLAFVGIAVLGAAVLAVVLATEDRQLGVKLFAVGFFSGLPAWLYWLFIARRGPALWDEYVLNLHRLGIDRPGALPEPARSSLFHAMWRRDIDSLGTTPLDPAENLYRKKFEGVFGQVAHDPTRSIFGTDNALPVIFSTILISVGWAIVVQPESVFGFPVLPKFAPADARVPVAELRFAFIGAYFYVLQMLVRRYYSNDLKAGAYVNATVRVIVVILLTWILGSVWTGEDSQPWRFGVAFTVGVLPDVGWQLLQRAIKMPLAAATDAFKQRYPLGELDGFNLWYEGRLLEEGVEDMQTLVTANLVDLLLHTRVPVERIIDWIDQAVLYLHLPPGDEPGTPRARLRHYGIRTATDLLDAFDPKGRCWRVTGIDRVLNDSTDPNAPVVLDAVRATLRREPVLVHVRRWKSYVDEYLRRGRSGGSVLAEEARYPEPVPSEAARLTLVVPTPASDPPQGG